VLRGKREGKKRPEALGLRRKRDWVLSVEGEKEGEKRPEA